MHRAGHTGRLGNLRLSSLLYPGSIDFTYWLLIGYRYTIGYRYRFLIIAVDLCVCPGTIDSTVSLSILLFVLESHFVKTVDQAAVLLTKLLISGHVGHINSGTLALFSITWGKL